MNYKKGEYRDQFVIAYITNFADYEDIVKWSVKFCNLFNKGLILLHISDKKYNNITTTEAQIELEKINNNLNISFVHSYVALQGKTKEIIHNVGELLNGVMIITKIDKFADKNNPININNIITNFYSSRIAYFCFNSYNLDNHFSNIIITMNALKECKEKILWASYFGRFANSVTHIYYKRYRDEYLQKQLNLNIGFLRKMFRKFQIQTLNAHSLNLHTALDVQALNYAENKNCDIVICQTTKNKSIIELFTGLQERKVLNLINKIPVLYLNPREDLFVLCE